MSAILNTSAECLSTVFLFFLAVVNSSQLADVQT